MTATVAPPLAISRQMSLGMSMGRIWVGWSKNPTCTKIDSGEKSDPHPQVKIQT
jgi:hypothetical protein